VHVGIEQFVLALPCDLRVPSPCPASRIDLFGVRVFGAVMAMPILADVTTSRPPMEMETAAPLQRKATTLACVPSVMLLQHHRELVPAEPGNQVRPDADTITRGDTATRVRRDEMARLSFTTLKRSRSR
jgi:hypothetical protein